MFKNDTKFMTDNPITSGLEMMFLEVKALRKMNFNEEEIELLLSLEYFNKYELFPVRKNEKITNKKILLDPVCAALVDFYFGAKKLVQTNEIAQQMRGVFQFNLTLIEDTTLESGEILKLQRQLFVAKSIVKKQSEWIYGFIFGNS
ncbi:MAG: hypothetical protein CFE24_11925 [Flavobacterium sp. BFFFF2]|nr:MAG: hypothetical protein CFE24_11925 [Flavobacterium sp. BFFFF2]